MNKCDNLLKLNDGKRHTPIRKVRISRGFNKQRALNQENKSSVKSKQYVVNDEGSNLYLGVYERHFIDKNGVQQRERKFKDIGLIDLIETLKQSKNNRHNPLPERIFDEKQIEFNRIFTLSPLDLVYVPTDEEIENPNLIDFEKLSSEQLNRVYNVNDFSSTCYFTPNSLSKAIAPKEVDSTYDSKKNKLSGSFDTKTASLNGKQIKEVCWKFSVDRLGKIKSIIH